VARPSPLKVTETIERERSPSQETALEQALRAAEMSYCNENWRDCGAQIKALLHRLEHATMAKPATLRILTFGDGLNRPTTLDDDLRCRQCCARLCRLVCRFVQRFDELCAAKIIKSTRHEIPLLLDILSLDASDLAAFRRGTSALVYDIVDIVLRARSRLTVDEAIAHLALVGSTVSGFCLKQLICRKYRSMYVQCVDLSANGPDVKQQSPNSFALAAGALHFHRYLGLA
tara:strand:+ start:79 stop:771 length:693 start_codon:yes stop_codon:yes gene_type:complete